MNDETRDERLRRLLREADPAAGEPGLATDEIHAMRRAVLTAIPESKPRFAPALVGAAAAVLVAIAVLSLWPRPESNVAPAPSKGISKIAVEKVTPPPTPGMNPRTTPVTTVAAGLRARRPVRSTPHRARHGRTEEPQRLAQQNETEPRTRQIQFSTTGGTRVIWILTSEKAL